MDGAELNEEYINDHGTGLILKKNFIGILPEIHFIISPGESDHKIVFLTLRVLRIVQLTRSIRAIEKLRVLIGVLLIH